MIHPENMLSTAIIHFHSVFLNGVAPRCAANFRSHIPTASFPLSFSMSIFIPSSAYLTHVGFLYSSSLWIPIFNGLKISHCSLNYHIHSICTLFFGSILYFVVLIRLFIYS